PVDLRTLAEVVLTLQGPLAASKDLELINAVPPDLPAADADEARLKQILHNLVGNAVKFTEEGKVEVSAAVEEGGCPTEGGQMKHSPEGGQMKHSPEGGQMGLRVVVEDTGIGIPQDKREQIFRAFEQVDSGVHRAFGGTGLGLTVTRELVELHGGRIQVESIAGQGSRFFFTLPASEEQAEPASSSERPVSRLLAIEPSAPLPQPGPGRTPSPTSRSLSRPDARRAERILVVDDEPVNLQVLSNHLVFEGYLVELAASGPEALALAQKRAFDLVVLDVMMPRMSGYEVCRALRERHSLEDLPVIFLTAKNQVSDLVAGLAAGGPACLAQPTAKDELLARVRFFF
ncbi:MAG: response regulator, partial [Actinomycetia bacterium]|nr:response regulator [Actinomycetes bacterium]